MYSNNARELVGKPKNRRIMTYKWIFRIKKGLTSSEPRRFKARLMAKGYTQKKRVNFKKVFSPLVRHASIRLFLALIVVQDMVLYKFC